MFLRFFESIWPMGAIDHIYAIKPIGKVFHWASDSDTDDELLAEPELDELLPLEVDSLLEDESILEDESLLEGAGSGDGTDVESDPDELFVSTIMTLDMQS